MKTSDVFLVHLSDMHSGGTTALFPDYEMRFKNGKEDELIVRPTSRQRLLFQHWLKCADEVKLRAKGKRMIVVHNGDAIEGIHHYTIQVISPNIKHHTEIHIELMEAFLKRSGFSRKNGDELHYTSGTESHTGWTEGEITKHFDHLGAGFHDEMRLGVNGRQFWYTHHGANAGNGANEGDGYRNWLKRAYWDCVKTGTPPPDLIATAHFHKSLYQTYVMDYHTLHGMITPSWQIKTRHAFRVAPFQKNDIGMSFVTVTQDGDIRVQKPLLLDPARIQ